MTQINDMNIGDLLYEYLKNIIRWVKNEDYSISNDETNKIADSLKQEILSRFKDLETENKLLEKALELSCDKIADVPIVDYPDFSKVPLELHAKNTKEWVQYFKQEADDKLEVK